MDLTTNQIAALIAIVSFELIGGGIIYWIADIKAFRRGLRTGARHGIESTRDELEPQLHEMTTRCTSAERLLTAARNEVRRLEDERDQHRRNTAEALEELTLRLDDAQVLNDGHATLLRQSANKFVHIAGQMQLIHLIDDARHAMTLADQLRNLAGWLKPQTVQLEVAA